MSFLCYNFDFNMYKMYINYLFILKKEIIFNYYYNGDWGLGIGDWAQSPIPNPQSPIPNPHENKDSI